jgi:hypothetical protein
MGNKTWDKVKGLLSKGAPIIGGLIGGPAGSTVATMVAGALGVEGTPEAIEMELTKNPDALLKIKELEARNKERLEEIALEDTKARLLDTQDARRTEIERLKSGGSNIFMYALAAIVVVGFFGVVGALFFRAIPPASEKVAYILLGTLAAEFGSIMRYFFGSSKGSSEKTAMLVKEKK